MAKGTLFVFVLHKPAGGAGVALLVLTHWCTRFSSSSWFLIFLDNMCFRAILPQMSSCRSYLSLSRWFIPLSNLRCVSEAKQTKVSNLSTCSAQSNRIPRTVLVEERIEESIPALAVLFCLLEYPRNFEESFFQLGLVARHDWKALKELRRTELICGGFWKATSDCCRNFLIQKNAPSQAPDIKGSV